MSRLGLPGSEPPVVAYWPLLKLWWAEFVAELPMHQSAKGVKGPIKTLCSVTIGGREKKEAGTLWFVVPAPLFGTACAR
jgi:hypothetical protein